MQYTLGQASRALAGRSHAYGNVDVRTAINAAIQALSGMNGWERLRRVVRIVSAQPRFALPQGCASLVRACVNGRPANVRGQDFEFVHSGPGHLRMPPPGFAPLHANNIIDRGMHPVMFNPLAPFHVRAGASVPDEPDITVKGVAPDGSIVREKVPVTGPDEPERWSVAEFAEIIAVVLDEHAAQYVDFFCGTSGSGLRLARYNPEVKVPEFRWYEIQGAPPRGVDVLAEVRIDPLPLVEDSDVLPFDTLDPIGWMMQADWLVKAGEVDAAQKLHGLAANWLKAREVAADMVQSSVIVNSVFDNSLGELSMDAVNI